MYILLGGAILVMLTKWAADSWGYRMMDVVQSPQEKTEANEGYGASHK